MSDTGNARIQSFPFTRSNGSPNGTTIFGISVPDATRSMYIFVISMVFDTMQNSMYLSSFFDRRLLILNITEDNIVISLDTSLSVIDSLIEIRPTFLAIDETSNSFYASTVGLRIVLKFTIGSTGGTIVAGDMITNSLFDRLADPQGLAVDSSGSLYIADTKLNRIVQVVNDNGNLRSIAGEFYQHYSCVWFTSRTKCTKDTTSETSFH